MRTLHTISSLRWDGFEKFVVSGKCAKLYHPDECLATNILFPLGKAKQACENSYTQEWWH